MDNMRKSSNICLERARALKFLTARRTGVAFGIAGFKRKSRSGLRKRIQFITFFLPHALKHVKG
jgi:hypothetical protein